MGDVSASSKPLIGRVETLAAHFIQSETRILSRDVLLLSKAMSRTKRSLQVKKLQFIGLYNVTICIDIQSFSFSNYVNPHLICLMSLCVQEDEEQHRVFQTQLEAIEKQTQNKLQKQKCSMNDKDSAKVGPSPCSLPGVIIIIFYFVHPFQFKEIETSLDHMSLELKAGSYLRCAAGALEAQRTVSIAGCRQRDEWLREPEQTGNRDTEGAQWAMDQKCDSHVRHVQVRNSAAQWIREQYGVTFLFTKYFANDKQEIDAVSASHSVGGKTLVSSQI